MSISLIISSISFYWLRVPISNKTLSSCCWRLTMRSYCMWLDWKSISSFSFEIVLISDFSFNFASFGSDFDRLCLTKGDEFWFIIVVVSFIWEWKFWRSCIDVPSVMVSLLDFFKEKVEEGRSLFWSTGSTTFSSFEPSLISKPGSGKLNRSSEDYLSMLTLKFLVFFGYLEFLKVVS